MHLRKFIVRPKYPENLKPIFELAYNIWTMWDPDAIKLFTQMSPTLFRQVDKNPVKFLYHLPKERVIELSDDKSFLEKLHKVYDKFQKYMNDTKDREFNSTCCNGEIAYFTMEFGLHASIPNYAGGLGILSGDHLKGASDLGIPLIGISLFYKYGYFRQLINRNGFQEEIFVKNNIWELPVKEVKDENGDALTIDFLIRGEKVIVKIWQVNVGTITLYMLDTNLDENPEHLRKITDHLYVSDREYRLMQEMVLGFVGPMLLDRLGVKPDVYHLNEGHSAFQIVQRLQKLKKLGYTRDEARAIIRSSTIFTTHTPVAAGNENFGIELIEKYLKSEIEKTGYDYEIFCDLGEQGSKDKFLLAVLAIHFSNYVNGVSQLHGEVSKKMWKDLFPAHDFREVPIIGITNGVHYTWTAEEYLKMFDIYVGEDYIFGRCDKEGWKDIYKIPDEEIWETHAKKKYDMIVYLRQRLVASYAKKGYSSSYLKKVSKFLNPNCLTVCFARRFASYKRATLILKDKNRLEKILKNPEKPIQFVFAGKAHPADINGKNLIKEIIDFAREYDVEDKFLFVEDYDINLGKYLVQGADIWLNNPIKPMEASGTSGMKAGMNGVLNLSVLDGWWPESYDGKNGWAINAGDIQKTEESRDIAEANQIYELLEEEISDYYYVRDERNIPIKWLNMMKHAMYTVFTDFNMNRMVGDYIEKFYIPSIKSREKMRDKKEIDKILEINNQLKHVWSNVYIKDFFFKDNTLDTMYSGDVMECECYVFLDSVNPELFDVEVFYYIEKHDRVKTISLDFIEKYSDNVAKFSGKLKIESSGLQYYNARLLPKNKDFRKYYPNYYKWRD